MNSNHIFVSRNAGPKQQQTTNRPHFLTTRAASHATVTCAPTPLPLLISGGHFLQRAGASGRHIRRDMARAGRWGGAGPGAISSGAREAAGSALGSSGGLAVRRNVNKNKPSSSSLELAPYCPASSDHAQAKCKTGAPNHYSASSSPTGTLMIRWTR